MFKQYNNNRKEWLEKEKELLKQHSFFHSKYNKPGSIIDVLHYGNNIKTYLIGSVNRYRSSVSDNWIREISNDDMILRVKELDIDYN